MSIDITPLLLSASENIISMVKNLTDKQGPVKKPIGIDTLSLVMKISISDLTPMIEYLDSTGQLRIHPNLANSPGGRKKSDCVSLV